MSDARKFLTTDAPFKMWRGGKLAYVTVAFETLGELNADKSNAVIVFTGLSPSAHIASSEDDPNSGWWEEMVGPGRAVDTNEKFVICFNSLGSCFGSTGPASINPDTGKPYGLEFPVLSLEDVAECGVLVLDHLDIEQVQYAIGPSMGGMTALAFCLMHPGRARHLVSLSSAARSLPFSVAVRSLQREIICSDPTWNEGNYTSDSLPALGMGLARKLGMITYRSAQEWDRRFGRERSPQTKPKHNDYLFSADFEVEAYLSAHAGKFVAAFDPNCYLYLSRASDLYDAADHAGSLETSFSTLKLKSALVVGVTTDILFPPRQQEELGRLFCTQGIDTDVMILDSVQGHDSFLVDMDRFRPALANYFRRTQDL